jgi:hypothetical protein
MRTTQPCGHSVPEAFVNHILHHTGDGGDGHDREPIVATGFWHSDCYITAGGYTLTTGQGDCRMMA